MSVRTGAVKAAAVLSALTAIVPQNAAYQKLESAGIAGPGGLRQEV
jgi:hypothetical protein